MTVHTQHYTSTYLILLTFGGIYINVSVMQIKHGMMYCPQDIPVKINPEMNPEQDPDAWTRMLSRLLQYTFYTVSGQTDFICHFMGKFH